MLEKLLALLDEEVENHRYKENEGPSIWDRGFENGSMTEALVIKNKIYKLMKEEKQSDESTDYSTYAESGETDSRRGETMLFAEG